MLSASLSKNRKRPFNEKEALMLYPEKIPQGQQWLMAIMHGLGYMQCDALSLPSFDPAKPPRDLYKQANFVYVISDKGLYFCKQTDQKHPEFITNDESSIQKILSHLVGAGAKTSRIENLSLKQLLSIKQASEHEFFLKGICNGVSTMAIPANLLGEKEIFRFNQRFKLAAMMLLKQDTDFDLGSDTAKSAIEDFSHRFKQAKANIVQNQCKFSNENLSTKRNFVDEMSSKISNASSFDELERSLTTSEEKFFLDKAIFDMQALFDGIMIAQSPSSFQDLVPEAVSTQTLGSALPLISPVLTDSSRDQIVVLEESLSAICNRDELKIIFSLIEKYFKNISCSMQFAASGHIINVSYHPNGQPPFLVTDVENLPSKKLSIDEISNFVAEHLSCRTGPVVFQQEIVVLNKNQASAHAALQSMMRDAQWRDIQQVTAEKAKLVTRNGQSWLHLAARTKNKELMNKLLDHGADPVLFDSLGESPYSLVGKKDSDIASMMWSKSCSNFKEANFGDKTKRGDVINRIFVEIERRNAQHSIIESTLNTISGNINKASKIKDRSEKLEGKVKQFHSDREALIERKDNLRKMKLDAVNEMSTLKSVDNFIAEIKKELIEKNIKVLSNQFDSVYAAFPQETAMAKKLVEIMKNLHIDFNPRGRILNKFEEKIKKECDQKIKAKTFLGWIECQLRAMAIDYQNPLGQNATHFIRAAVSILSPKINIGPTPLSAKFDAILHNDHDDEAKIEEVIGLFVDRVKEFLARNPAIKRQFEVIKIAARLPGITPETIKKDFLIGAADIKGEHHTIHMAIKVLQMAYHYCQEKEGSDNVLSIALQKKLMKKIDDEVPGIHAVERKTYNYPMLERTLKQDPRSSSPPHTKGK